MGVELCLVLLPSETWMVFLFLLPLFTLLLAFPNSSIDKESACNSRDPGSIPGLGRWDRLSTPVSRPVEFHGLYCPGGHKESDTTERLHFTSPYFYS